MTDTTIDTTTRAELTQAPRLPLNVLVEQAYSIDEAIEGYVRRMDAQPNRYAVMFGYVYVWRVEE